MSVAEFVDVVNGFAWVFGNFVLGVSTFLLIVFVIAYPILFDPRATTVGRYLLRFLFGLVGVVGLVFIGTFVDPRYPWYEYPPDIVVWRPIFRAVVYAFMFYGLVSLSVLLVARKWFPDKMRSAPEDTLNLRLRAPKK